MLFRACVLVVTTCALAGCVTEPPIDQLSHTELEALAEEIVVSCEAQGVKRETAEMDVCFRTEARREIDRRDSAAEARASIGPAIAAGLSSYGASQQRAASTYRAPINCTSSRMGTYVNTTCY